MSTTQLSDLDNTQVHTDLLGKRVLLLSPTLSLWRGQVRLPSKAEVHMDDRVLDAENVTQPRVKLMTNKYPVDSDGKPWKARFDACSSRLTALKSQFSVGFPISGVRIIPREAAAGFMTQLFGDTIGSLRASAAKLRDNGLPYAARALENRIGQTRDIWADMDCSDKTPVYNPEVSQQSIAYEFWESVRLFVADYPEVIRQIRERNDCWDLVSRSVPANPRAMLAKFNLGVFPIELSGGTPNAVSLADLEAHAAVVRETCQQQVEMAIESMIAEPRRELAETLQNIETLIADNGRVTSRTFDRVRRAMEKLRNFSFVANDALMARISQLDQILEDTVPSSLSSTTAESTAAARAFSATIAAVRTEVSDPGIMEEDLVAFGCRRRSLCLDDD